MTDDQLLGLIDPVLRDGGSHADEGEDYRRPAVEVLRYYRRPLKWNPVPILGRALSVVAVARATGDDAPPGQGHRQLLERTAMVVGARYSPWQAPTIGLTVVGLTDEPIGAGTEADLDQALGSSMRRFRVVPLGLILVNLDRETLSFALRAGPDQLFPEPVRVADVLGDRLRRFVDQFPS
ncbi:hypothetical protein OJF2_16700 [Aquisphaera giovannonii]|uniref:Uncharacterized protein n=1 Tax=Aquisphaera giovannonii TaxID=406548 RepID=A0A5B9VXV9_9BACT|nr:hypothetical protein [Aquisphaera giovannonii]QEH33173.1 hypothetical protein OJF2_16700 [Aquisphaera giovannonii]